MTEDRGQRTVKNARRRRSGFYCRLLSVICYLSLIACAPKYDWRDVRGSEPPYTAAYTAPYTALMPGKPSRLSREIQLGTQTVTMHMTAVQIGEVKFVIGAVSMTDADQARAAIPLIKNALLTNLAGVITQETTTVAMTEGKPTTDDQFSAINPKTAIRMTGRLVARGNWVFEVLALGPEQDLKQDAVNTAVNTFLTSFKPI